MDKFRIRGGRQLEGTVKIEGAKNAVLALMAGALMAEDGASVLDNVPAGLADVRVMSRLMEAYGAQTDYDREQRKLRINVDRLKDGIAPYDLVKQMRASFLISGPLLARFGHFRVSLPGGCAIGARPVDLHLDGFRRLGAQVIETEGYIEARADRLKGTTLCLDYPTHTGTENLMMAACLADGETTIVNAAQEPEVADLARFLVKMGARISGIGTSVLVIDGVGSLAPATHTVLPDRLAAGTFAVAAAVTGGKIVLEDVIPDTMRMTLCKLEEMGLVFEETAERRIEVRGPTRLSATDVKALPFPGFPTDMQPPIMVAMALAHGASSIRETVFESRFVHVAELNRMGANIRTAADLAIIVGVGQLQGAPVMAGDIRAGSALVLAGLAAVGETIVDRVYHIDRAYSRLERQLAALGADIHRIE
jgi:UDP-N-acetylglucosamine 1-carboxyvinyltransferase